MKYSKVFIVGGAGFLGYHTCLELVSRGVQVTALALPNELVDDSLSSAVNLVRADVDKLSDFELGEMLSGHDSLIYAAGPDDRIELPPNISATDFFQKQLVGRTDRVLNLAKTSGLRHAVVFGSYFSYVNNHGLAGLKLGSLERHPYIKARVDQTRHAFALGDDNFSVSILNIPYVFGTAPNKEPIWRAVFVDKYKSSPKIIYGNGGTTVVSAKKVAFAAAQALEYGKHGDELAIGSINMKLKPMIERLLRAAEIDKPVANMPTWLLGMFMKASWKKAKKANLDFGLDLRYLASDILGRDFYVDFESTDLKLDMVNYHDDVDGAIDETGQLMKRLDESRG